MIDGASQIDDSAVVEHLRRRPDAPGTLVALEDGRHAITGTTLAVGGANRLARYSRERARRAADPEERAWWETLGRRWSGGRAVCREPLARVRGQGTEGR
jgi:hypothetical protein